MLCSSHELSVLTIRKELELVGTNIAIDAAEDSATATTQLSWAYCTKAIDKDTRKHTHKDYYHKSRISWIRPFLLIKELFIEKV